MDAPLAAVLLQAFTAGAACIAAYATARVITAGRKRRKDRIALGGVIDIGNRLLDDYHHDREADDELDRRYQAWENQASSAVDAVDISQHPRYHAQIPDQFSRKRVIEERLRRLQEIQDRL